MINPGADPGLLAGSILVIIAAIGHALMGAAVVFATSTLLANSTVWGILNGVLATTPVSFLNPLLIGVIIGVFFGFFLLMLLIQVIFSSKCLSITNLLCLLINMVLFAAIGGAAFLAPQYAPTVRELACSIGSSFDTLYETPKGLTSGLTADTEFCSTNCECKGTNAAWVGTAYASHAPGSGFDAGSTVIKYADCTTTAAEAWKTAIATAPLPIVLSVVSQGEVNLKCGGICTFSWFYIFSDVTKGLPERTCVDALIGQITDNSMTILIVGAALMLSQLLGIIGSFMICCSANSQCCGTGCTPPAIAKMFAIKEQNKVAKVQNTTPMLVVIP